MVREKTIRKIEAIATACIGCRMCMQECIMLGDFTRSPKMLFSQYLKLGPDQMSRRIAYSCNECGQCTLKCPRKLELRSVFKSLKADYAAANGGIVPLRQLEASELAQQKECSEAYCTVIPGAFPGRKETVSVPGCNTYTEK